MVRSTVERQQTKEVYARVKKILEKQVELYEEIDHLLLELKPDEANEEVHMLIEYLLDHYHRHHPLPLFVETTPEGVITDVNKDFAELSKYDRDELIGRNINMLRSSRMERGVFTDMWNHLSAGKPWRGELQNRSKDYNSYWIDTVVCPVHQDNEQIEKYWSLSFDITPQMHQRDEIEAKNRDVLESLKYAKRIQKTILPAKKVMDEEFEEYFVLFKPKDVVSGDFYWFITTINKVYIAVVDCTGHGVPGAFMSLIGYNLLNQIVGQQNIQHPGEILTELHRQVRATLRQDESDTLTQDGMDVCLLCIDRYGETIEYAGAQRPLYWVHRDSLQIITADKMSIGGEQMEEERIFTNHELQIEANDVVYMFSDGFVDQLGGPRGKKFSSKQLRTLIQENHPETMTVQKALFNIVWKDWRGDGEQIDDVTLIGIRFAGTS